MKRILVLGAGQLARMMALAGDPLRLHIRAYDVRTQTCIHPITEEIYADNLTDALKNIDVITAEFEHIAPDILQQCAATGRLFPNVKSILIGGDRRLEKKMLKQANIACAPFQVINTFDDLQHAVEHLKLPFILKSTLDGYDGKGQWRLHHRDEIASLWQTLVEFIAQSPQSKHQSILAESYIPFSRELSILGIRTQKGSHHYYPLTENLHQNGILGVSLVYPVSHSLQQQAQAIFDAIAQALNYVGVLAIELFQIDDRLLVNEIAPRVHNSGHWTQDGASISQFNAHLHAICDFPLPAIQTKGMSAMINIIGDAQVPDAVLQWGYCHWYHKTPDAGRKVGHINVCAQSVDELIFKMTQIQTHISAKAFPCLETAIQRLKDATKKPMEST